MVKIRRGNVVLRVKPEDVDRYHAMGYDVYGEDGQIVRPAHPDIAQELQVELDGAKAEIEMLTARIEELEQELEKAKAAKKSGKKDKKE